jgi:hypothetical protein
MRSSKSRSRSKSNRNRPSGNIVNRVFDSSGPEGKVRGTPQQIIDKYNQLARDAQLSNDRVAAENFQQHAEHYTRLLSEAMREMDARRDQQDRERPQGQHRREDGARDDSDREDHSQHSDMGSETEDDVIDTGADHGGGLVETPENAQNAEPARPKRQRRPKAKGADVGEGRAAPESQEAAE